MQTDLYDAETDLFLEDEILESTEDEHFARYSDAFTSIREAREHVGF